MNNNTNADVIQLPYRAKKRGESVNKHDNSFNMIQLSNKQRDSIPWKSGDLINEQGYTRQTHKHIHIIFQMEL